MKRTTAAAFAAFALSLGLVVASATPSMAASKNGSYSCGYVYVPHMKIESSTAGHGSWQNLDDGWTSGIIFAAGTSLDNRSPYQRVNWVITNGAGYFYSQPYLWCA
jgi:hypothetical protein